MAQQWQAAARFDLLGMLGCYVGAASRVAHGAGLLSALLVSGDTYRPYDDTREWMRRHDRIVRNYDDEYAPFRFDCNRTPPPVGQPRQY